MAEDNADTGSGMPAYNDQDPSAEEHTQDDFEANLEADLNPANNSTVTQDPAPGSATEANGDTAMQSDIPAIETRIPAKKDATLREFLSKMDDYAPIVRQP